jgi:AcrR family transcriptional regulator
VTTTAGAPAGLRERKKEHTRHALEDAALDLFVRKGFDHTTVEEIAAACDVSTRTFFRYFATKEDVLLCDKPMRIAEAVSVLESRPTDEPPLRSVRDAMHSMITSYSADRERFVARSRVIADSPALSASKPAAQVDFEQALVDALTRRDAAAGVPPRVFDLRLAVGVVSAAYRAAIDTWLAGNDDRDLESIVDEAFDRLTTDLTG